MKLTPIAIRWKAMALRLEAIAGFLDILSISWLQKHSGSPATICTSSLCCATSQSITANAYMPSSSQARASRSGRAFKYVAPHGTRMYTCHFSKSRFRRLPQKSSSSSLHLRKNIYRSILVYLVLRGRVRIRRLVPHVYMTLLAK